MSTIERGGKKVRAGMRFAIVALFVMSAVSGSSAWGQTDCAEGNGVLDTTPPKDMTVEQLIQKFAAEETKVQEARTHYTYMQDALVQTLNEKAVDGQFHEISSVSYGDKDKRMEHVSFAEQSTLRSVSLTQEDMDDIHIFMQWILTTDEVGQYKLTYAGQQHVDDLDTYVFHVEPKKEEKSKRYFEGRIWVDNRDFQIVKLCGKSVPDMVRPKKHQPLDIRPTFVAYRQLVDKMWFPAYARVDDTLHFQVQSIQLREIVKFTGYKRMDAVAGKP